MTADDKKISHVFNEIKTLIKFSSIAKYNEDYLKILLNTESFLLVKNYHLKKYLCCLEMLLEIEMFIILK